MAAQKTLLEMPRRSLRPVPISGARTSTRPSPLDEATRGQIYRQWRRGVSVAILAEEYERSPVVIERAINEGRALRILEQKLEFMFDPSFEAPHAAETILAAPPAPNGRGQAQTGSRMKVPTDLPPYLASLYVDAPLLSREQEAHLFR